MHITDIDLYKENLDRALSNVPSYEKLAGKRILLTGASGLIGSAVADMLFLLNERSYEIEVTLAGRSEERLRKRFPHADFTFAYFDTCEEADLRGYDVYDYIIHAAGEGAPNQFMENPTGTLLSSVRGTETMLRLLSEARDYGIEGRLLYVSSSEVYGNFAEDDGTPHREDDYGRVDFRNPRSCYPMGKRAAESLIYSAIAQYSLDAVIVRPGHIYGPTATERDERVSSKWPREVLDGRDIRMSSSGEQKRSYVYMADCAGAILTVLLGGVTGEVYNIADTEEVTTIYEMARAFARAGNVAVSRIEPTKEEQSRFNPMLNSSLNGDQLSSLGYAFSFSMEEGARDTLHILHEMSENK